MISTSQGSFRASRPWIGAINSIRLFVVCGSNPKNSFLTPPNLRMQAHPPGPRLPRQDPSVMSETFFMLSKLPLVRASQAPFNHGISRRGLPIWEYQAVKCPQHLELELPRYLQIDFMPFEERTIQGYEDDRT